MIKTHKITLLLIIVLLVFSFASKSNDLKRIKYEGITRTTYLLETSNQSNRNRVDILFYGQSIIGGLKSDVLIDSLKKRFPFANIKHKNKAIGGFALPSLIKTAEHDLYQETPDLIIFHGYEGIEDGVFDSLIYNIRSKLSSDLLLFNHHYVWDKPQSKLDSINKFHDFDSKQIENIAKKYSCGFVNVREQWKEYLDSNNVHANELIGNTIEPNVHPNDKGNALLRSILLSAFENSSNQKYDTEKDALREVVLLDDTKTHTNCFKSNRLILETDRRFNEKAKVEVFINDNKPSEFKSNYLITRPSKGYKSWMPGLKKVSMGSFFPRKEEWRLKIFEIDRANKTFKYSLIGSLTGFDGEGSSQSNFISNSGRISINKSDWNIFEIEKITKNQTPENFEINFEVILLVNDILELERSTSKYLLFKADNVMNLKLDIKITQGNPTLKKLHAFRPYITQ